MDDLEAQLVSDNALTKIRILGVNAAGLEAGNATITSGTTIPWLQDTVSANVYGSWGGTQLTLHVLDTFNIRRSVWDHVSKPLGAANDANWTELKALLKTVAGE